MRRKYQVLQKGATIMDNLIKKDINNNFSKLEKNRNCLVRCEIQLSDKKKIENGYNIFDSVLDVVQGGYAISYGDDVLFTYGIEPCCGVVLYDNQKSILFHLDGTTSPDEVKKVTDSFGFYSDAKLLIFPGVTCGIPGSFTYTELEKLYSAAGYDTEVYRINGSFGYIGISGSDVRFGSLLRKEIETTFSRQKSHKR